MLLLLLVNICSLGSLLSVVSALSKQAAVSTMARQDSDYLMLHTAALNLEASVVCAETLLVNVKPLSERARRKVEKRRRHLARVYLALREALRKLGGQDCPPFKPFMPETM